MELRAPAQLDDIIHEKRVLSRAAYPASAETAKFEPTSLATMLLKTQSEAYKAKEELTIAQKQHTSGQQSLETREDAVADELKHFCGSLEHFARFVSDNETKQNSARATIASEEKFTEYLNYELDQTKRQLRVADEQKRLLNAIALKMKDFAAFMGAFKPGSGSFSSVQEVFARHEALTNSAESLRKMTGLWEEAAREERGEIDETTRLLSQQVFAINEAISTEIGKIDNESSARQLQGGLGDAAAQELEDVQKELAEVSIAEKNIYEQCKRMSHLRKTPTTFEARLDVVGTFLGDMVYALGVLGSGEGKGGK